MIKNICLHVKSPSFLSVAMNLEVSRHIFEKYSNIKFNEKPSIGSRVFPCGWLDGRTSAGTYGLTDRRTKGETDMTKLIVGLRNFVIGLKMRKSYE